MKTRLKKVTEEEVVVAQEVAKKEVFIDGSQLKKLQDFEVFTQESKMFLGDLTIQYEFKKASVMQQIIEQENKIAEIKKDLEAIHGQVHIDLATGLVTLPEKEEVK